MSDNDRKPVTISFDEFGVYEITDENLLEIISTGEARGVVGAGFDLICSSRSQQINDNCFNQACGNISCYNAQCAGFNLYCPNQA